MIIYFRFFRYILGTYQSASNVQFAAEDYCADLGINRTPSRMELLYARSAVVTAAVAHDLHTIDMVCLDFNNDRILEEECREGKQLGFTGKVGSAFFFYDFERYIHVFVLCLASSTSISNKYYQKHFFA